MHSFESYLLVNTNVIPVILVNFAIALILLVGIKYISAAVSHVQAKTELSVKDNGAFGISTAGVILGVIIMTTGIMTDEASLDLSLLAMMMAGYGLLGIALMFVTRVIFDDLAMPRIKLRDEILRGNMAAGIVDAGNVIASALVVRAVMYWVNSYTWQGLVILLIAYFLSQLFLTLVVRLGLARFQRRHNAVVQHQVGSGNVAVALRFAGFRIGTALAITAASQMVPYAYDEFLLPMVSWLIMSLVIVIITSVVAWLADHIILSDINLELEVDSQRNIAVGSMQAAIHISVGLLMMALMF